MPEDKRALPVIFRQAANAVGGEKFFRTQKSFEQPPQLALICDGQLILPPSFDVVAAAVGKLFPIFYKPQEIGLEFLKVLNVVEPECFRRIQRDNSHQRAHAKFVKAAVW